jgi:NAD(P)H dehydrogenase (quinone)
VTAIVRRGRSLAGTRKSRRVLVVFCHPIRTSYMGALLDETVRVLSDAKARHEVRVLDLYAEGFDPELSQAEWRAYLEPPDTKPAIAEHVAALRWADVLVLVYPTWFGSQPAMLKGWFDRVFASGVAFDLPHRRTLLRPLLTNIRTIRAVTVHGSGKWMNCLQGEPGKRMALRGLSSVCHPLASTRWIALYGNDRLDDAARKEFLAQLATRL